VYVALTALAIVHFGKLRQ